MKDLKNDLKFKISRAKTKLLQSHPFYGSMALFMDFVEAPDLNPKTMATDGKRIFWHPEFVAAKSVEELQGVIAHEVLHKVLKHHLRRGKREPKRWNYAADYAINPLLLNDALKLPPEGLNDKRYLNMSAEQIYNLLPENYDQGRPGAGDFGQVIDAPGKNGGQPTAAEISEMEREVNVETLQAALQAKMQGKLPGRFAQLIEAATTPQVDWRDRFRATLGRGTPDDYTWARPNRTFLTGFGVYLPTMVCKGVGTIVAVMDTSGSISDRDAAAYLSEFNAIIQDCKPERAILIQCDAEVQHVQEVNDGTPLKHLKIHGRGGTDFRPPFEYLKKHDILPEAVVYLTDLYGTFPERQPDYPVLWVATNDGKAPWGETVQIKV